MVALQRELAVPAPSSSDAIPLRLRRRGGTPRQVFAITLVGAIVLAPLAASDLPGWADRLEDGPLADIARPLAAQWTGAIERLGLTRPHEALRDAMRRALDRQW
jgi:hypothetical protein